MQPCVLWQELDLQPCVSYVHAESSCRSLTTSSCSIQSTARYKNIHSIHNFHTNTSTIIQSSELQMPTKYCIDIIGFVVFQINLPFYCNGIGYHLFSYFQTFLLLICIQHRYLIQSGLRYMQVRTTLHVKLQFVKHFAPRILSGKVKYEHITRPR